MKAHQLPILVVLIGVGLAACDNPSNPLTLHNPEMLAGLVIENELAVEECVEDWSQPKTLGELTPVCTKKAKQVAELFSRKKLGATKAEHILLPQIWVQYQKLANASTIYHYDASEARHSMDFLNPKK